MRRYFSSALTILVSMCLSQMAFAWGDTGHSVVGGIAETTIKPATKDFIRGILGVEPLAAAAVWPDHVRNDDRFDPAFSNFHFCEVPVGFTYATRIVKPPKDCHGAIIGAEKILVDRFHKYTNQEKMIAVRYLVHLVGDIHQPYHVGNGHDMGANACNVLWQPTPNNEPKAMNLHSFWDETMVEFLGKSFFNKEQKRPEAKFWGQFVNEIKFRHQDMFKDAEKYKTQLGAGSLESWLDESGNLRESGLYPDDAQDMQNVPKGEEYLHRSYCQKGGAPKTLTNEYASKHVSLIEDRLLRGGFRLASILDSIAYQATHLRANQPTLTDEQQAKILNRVEKLFQPR